jgi:DNA polymerase/3'-5' exonuclease PolX
MAKLKSKVVELAKKSEAKKKRTLMGKGKGKGIKADKPLKKLGKSLRRIRKNPGGFAAAVVDAASVVGPASIARKGVKIVGKTERGRKIIGDLQKILKKRNTLPSKTKKGVKTTPGRTKAPKPSAANLSRRAAGQITKRRK